MNSRRYTIGRTRYQHYYPTGYHAELPVFGIPNAILQLTSLTLLKVLVQVGVLAITLVLLKYDVPISARVMVINQQAIANIEDRSPIFQSDKTLNNIKQRQPARIGSENQLVNLLQNIEQNYQANELILITRNSVDGWKDKKNKNKQQSIYQIIKTSLQQSERQTVSQSVQPVIRQKMKLTSRNTQSSASGISNERSNNDGIYGLFVNGVMAKDRGLVVLPIDLSKRRFVSEFINKVRYQLADIGWSTLVVFITGETSADKNQALSLVYRYALSLNYQRLITISAGDLQGEVENSFEQLITHTPMNTTGNRTRDIKETAKNILFIGINPILQIKPQGYRYSKQSQEQLDIEYRYILTDNSEYASQAIGASSRHSRSHNNHYIKSNDDDRQLQRRITGWLRHMK